MSWFYGKPSDTTDRPSRNLPTINYAEESDEEDLETGLDFGSPLTSPRRPLPTREGSPVGQVGGGPTLADCVDDELEEVQARLEDILETNNLSGDKSEEVVEEVLEGQIKVPAEVSVAAMPDQPAIVNFEDENGDDTAGALREGIQAVAKINWDDNDLKFVFKKMEISIAAAGAKKQYTKFQILSTILPKHIEDEVKSLLEMQESEFTENNAYKQLKSEIMRIFGPKPSAAIDRALNRVLVGKPSVLARALAGDVNKKLDCDGCLATIFALWKRNLPSSVRAGIAHMEFTKANFNAITQLADDIYESQPSAAVAAVRFDGAAAAAQQSLDVTQPGLTYPVQEVNAVTRGGRGRGNRSRGNRGSRGRGGRGGQGSGQGASGSSRHKGTKHPDLPAGEWLGCSNHFKFGKGAYFCSEPATCPWKNIYSQRPAK